jgi:hypothetical protein
MPDRMTEWLAVKTDALQLGPLVSGSKSCGFNGLQN